MLANPKPGCRAVLHYGKGYARLMPHHGWRGTVVAAATGPGPRNHLVRLDAGPLVAVPCGNLNPDPWTDPAVSRPADGSRVDVLHPDGTVSRGVRYRHWDFWEWPPLFGPLGRDVAGWKPASPAPGDNRPAANS